MDAIAKLQVQVPNNTLNNPDGDPTSKTARNNSERTDNSNLSHHLSHHPCDSRGFSSGISDDRKFMHDPGGIIFSIKDLSACDDSDRTNSTSSSSSKNTSCNGDAHFSFDRDCDKTVSTVSDVDPIPFLDFVQVNRLVDAPPHLADNLPPMLPTDSSRANVQHAPSLRFLGHPLDFCQIASDVTRTPPAPHRDNNRSSNSNYNYNDADNSSNNSSNEPVSIAINITTRAPSINNSDFGVDAIISEEPDTLDNNGNSNSNTSNNAGIRKNLVC